MTSKLKLSTGKEVLISTGLAAVYGTVRWQIRSEMELVHDEIEEVIEAERPFAGYGNSVFTRSREGKQFVVTVDSNGSCD